MSSVKASRDMANEDLFTTRWFISVVNKIGYVLFQDSKTHYFCWLHKDKIKAAIKNSQTEHFT